MGGVCSPQFLDARQKTCKSQKWRSGPVWQKYIIVADISSWKREAVTNLILCVLLAVRAKTSCAASSVRSRRPTTSWEVPHISLESVTGLMKQESRCPQEFSGFPNNPDGPSDLGIVEWGFVDVMSFVESSAFKEKNSFSKQVTGEGGYSICSCDTLRPSRP